MAGPCRKHLSALNEKHKCGGWKEFKPQKSLLVCLYWLIYLQLQCSMILRWNRKWLSKASHSLILHQPLCSPMNKHLLRTQQGQHRMQDRWEAEVSLKDPAGRSWWPKDHNVRDHMSPPQPFQEVRLLSCSWKAPSTVCWAHSHLST